VGAVDERLGQIQFAPFVEISSERPQDPIENTLSFPLLKASVARLVRGVAVREVGPWCSRPKDPEDAVENIAGIAPRPPTLRRCSFALRARNEALDRVPLLVRQVHP
jgi:hypothetical protein